MSRAQAERLVTDPERITRHSFLPFITYEIAEPRYKAAQKRVVNKIRPIGFSAHADSHIFAYYASELRQRLEDAIISGEINSSVLAYRRLPGHKCNIHFANEVFEEVRARGNCVAIAIDVEQFFDSLDHLTLKNAWSSLKGEVQLPEDYYSVYKAITRYAKIDRNDLFQEFGIGVRAQRRLRGPVCSPSEFRERVRGKGLISTNSAGKGIPQGSPISASLSNLYMLERDIEIQRYAESIGGSYRRYSDDILLICDQSAAADFESFVKDQLEKSKLDVNSDKTQRSFFQSDGAGGMVCDHALQYLGFTFDGRRKLVRSKTLARYMRRVIQGVASAARAARKAGANGGDPRIRKAEIFERYSHLGRRNFIRYAYRAAEIMNDESPRRQVRKHWKRLNRILSEFEAE